MTLALIDGDIIAYRAAAGNQQSYDWGEGILSTAEDTGDGLDEALAMVANWIEKAGCDRAIVCFTGPHNFRKHVWPGYKAGRKEKPAGYWAVVDAIKAHYPNQTVDGLEADDVMGILSTTPKYQGSVIVSLDKDMRTIPGHFFNPDKHDFPIDVSEAEANHWWLTQTLTGDPTDGYPGARRVGPVAAQKALGQFNPKVPLATLWSRVEAAYRKAGETSERALLMARMARILRREDYDKTTKEIRLWHPKSPENLPLGTVCTPSSIP